MNIDGTRFISFSLGTEEFAIPLLDVREVIALPEFTPVPYSPPYFTGIINLRGQVISVLDLRQKLGIKPMPNAETAVIICEFNQFLVGVIVDSVNTVLAPKDGEIVSNPDLKGHKSQEFVSSVYRKDKKIILFLNISKALNLEDHQIISKQASSERKVA